MGKKGAIESLSKIIANVVVHKVLLKSKKQWGIPLKGGGL